MAYVGESQGSPETDTRFSSLTGIDYGSSGKTLTGLIRGMLWAALVGILGAIFFAAFLPFGVIRPTNEASAMNSIRIIAEAQMKYRNEFPNSGFACSLQALGGTLSKGLPTSESAQLIRADLASGVKNGYFFEIRSCKMETRNRIEVVTRYRVVALPIDQGKSGNRSFCADESGNLRVDPKGGDNCTESLFK